MVLINHSVEIPIQYQQECAKAWTPTKISTMSEKTVQLSSKIQGMRFMNRAKEAKIRQDLETQKRILSAESLWVIEDVAKFKKVHVQPESSYMDFMDDLNPMARQSFQDFNKDIQNLASIRDSEKQVSDNEMAERLKKRKGSPNDSSVKDNTKSKKKKKDKQSSSEWTQDDVGRQATRFAAGQTFIKPE